MIKKLSKYLNGLWALCFLSAGGMVIEAICELSLPKIANLVYNDVNSAGAQISHAVKYGLIMLGLAIIGLAGGLITMRASSVASQKFSYRLRKDVYGKVSDFSFKNIDSFSTSSLTTRLTNDITALQNTLLMGLRMLFRAPALMIVAAILAFRINHKLSLVLIFILPVIFIIIVLGL